MDPISRSPVTSSSRSQDSQEEDFSQLLQLSLDPHFYWYNLAGRTTDNIDAEWLGLSEKENFDQFVELLSDLAKRYSDTPTQENALIFVRVIDYVIKNPDVLKEVFPLCDESESNPKINAIDIFKHILSLDKKSKSEIYYWYDLAGVATEHIEYTLTQLSDDPDFCLFKELLCDFREIFTDTPDRGAATFMIYVIESAIQYPIEGILNNYLSTTDVDTDYVNTLKQTFRAIYRLGLTEKPAKLKLSEETIHLHWYSAANLSTEGLDDQWEELKEISDFAEFATLLYRLTDKNLEGRVDPLEVVEIIQAIIQSNSLAEIIFKQAQSAGQNCLERPLNFFKSIQSITRFHTLETMGAEPKSLLKLIKGIIKEALLGFAAKEVYKKQWEEKRSYSHVYDENPQFKDDEPLEYHTALCEMLEEQLELPFPVYGIYTRSVAALTYEDLVLAKNFVNDMMLNDLAGKLLAQPVWFQYMERRCTAAIKAIQEHFGDQLAALDETQDKKPKKVVNSDYYLDPDYIAQSNHIMSEQQSEINELLKTETQKLLDENS